MFSLPSHLSEYLTASLTLSSSRSNKEVSSPVLTRASRRGCGEEALLYSSTYLAKPVNFIIGIKIESVKKFLPV